MSILLYARVSTERQAERELSIPAQLRLMERFANEQGLIIAGRYQDIGSGRSLRDRPGLTDLLTQLRKDRSINGVIVHKIDRLSRNTFNYLVLKARLRTSGVRLYSVVENIEETPLGEFFEHIMAAQAEFYSANLAAEVKKGLEERLRRGRWTAAPPIGYLMRAGRIVVDPARGHFIRQGFESWAEGQLTARALADQLYTQGLVGRRGTKLEGKHWCRLLKNTFYQGQLFVKEKRCQGVHPPLVSPTLFERCQEVFRQKRGQGKRHRRHLTFLLAGKLRCPRCASSLVGERHQKPSGKEYRYYRCHQSVCRYVVPTGAIEQEVREQLLGLQLPSQLLPILRRRAREAKQRQIIEQADRVRELRQEQRRLEEELHTLAHTYFEQKIDEQYYDHERTVLKESLRATAWLLAVTAMGELNSQESLAVVLSSLSESLHHPDPVVQRGVIEQLIAFVELRDEKPQLCLSAVIEQLLDEVQTHIRVPLAAVRTV